MGSLFSEGFLLSGNPFESVAIGSGSGVFSEIGFSGVEGPVPGFGIYQCDNSALGHFVANLDCNLSNDTTKWSGHIQRFSLSLSSVISGSSALISNTRSDQNFYDINRLEIADIREANFFWISHVLLQGFRSGVMNGKGVGFVAVYAIS
ncbi:MAG: hypothetical protein Ct9H300mP14_08280 [Gammaproteobacteria bacterium]|nr:MAG: hypothetical protein Ct9H300mP14_08280 [Gammaproteobacteria bacterium]